MKAVKAYLRSQKVEEVVQALEKTGIDGMTVVDVMGIGTTLADRHTAKYSIECVEQYSKVAKLEIVCPAMDVHRVLKIIRETAYTGMKGDGLIFVSPVEMVVKIRTGASTVGMMHAASQ